MTFKRSALGLIAAAAIVAPTIGAAQAAQDGIYIPLLTYRTGPFADSGTPIANGLNDYFQLLNTRDGGINGVKLIVEECETGYKTDVGVECYERTKTKGAVVYNPYSTGITNAIIPKTPDDKIPVLSMGYGLTPAADGRVFPWVFNMPTTYWSQASVFVKYVAQQEGGFDKLKGKKIGLIHLDHPYGKEPIPTLQKLAGMYGFEFVTYPVPPKTMQDQRSTWEKIDDDAPDWLFMWGWGAMNPTAIKGAIDVDYPMDHFIGVWWSGNESDVRDSGKKAEGYLAGEFHGVGDDWPLFDEIRKYVIGKSPSQTPESMLGETLYNRGIMNAVIVAEAIRTAMGKFGNKVINGEEMRWGLENINLTAARLKELGLEGFTIPIRVSCEDHEGNHPVYLKRWDGSKWVKHSDWISPMRNVVRPLIEAEAKKLAEERHLPIRECK
ncbi:MAG: ABC transporter permease [Alphaproteobacteria bacterium]|nr:MAG: ABC transporter permease [Alphaproteobacteria bacterium]